MAFGNSSKRAVPEMANRLTEDSSVPLPNLPEEIITEIILRLPVKSLVRFRCVSKSWLSLISSPQFANTHLKISTNNNTNCHNRLIFGSGPRPTCFHNFSLNPKIGENSIIDTLMFDYPSNDLDAAIRVVGSCNGLVCVAMDPCDVVMWNPATRKSKKLPVCSDNRNLFELEYGYGYDSSNDDYKVVEFSWIDIDEGLYDTQVKVYSSKADSWRVMDWPGGRIFDGPGIFVNGSIHWKVYYNDDPSNWVVIAQNVASESCSSVELPKLVGEDAKHVTLSVSGGCLCALFDYRSYMDVWVMKEYGVRESWTKLVCFPYYFCTNHLSHFRPKVLYVSENGGILLNLGPDLIMYKPSQYHEVHRLGNHIEIEAASYCESLLSPDHLASHYGEKECS